MEATRTAQQGRPVDVERNAQPEEHSHRAGRFPHYLAGMNHINFRANQDAKVVGLKRYSLSKETRKRRLQLDSSTRDEGAPRHDSSATLQQNAGPSLEEKEEQIRENATRNPFSLLFLGTLSALKVFGFYLITLETVLTACLSVGLTVFWYDKYKDDPDWNGGSLDFILLAFAVITPISASIGMAFARRERSLAISIANFRSFSYHIYLAHCAWDWEEGGGRKGSNHDWRQHCDGVMTQLVGIGDELSRFLTLPSASRSRHRMTRSGRKEAKQTMEVAYQLLESITTQRMTRLTLYSERLKNLGLSVGEVSRIRQYERFLSDSIEQLRMVKLYRTPQALRSFGRVFTMILPPFYAPNYAQVAIDVKSLEVGIAFALITSLGLTALFESLQVLEDPFTAFLTLDGIDVREEFVVLNFSQLQKTRSLFFPFAKPFPVGRRAALTGDSRINVNHHHRHPNHAGSFSPLQSRNYGQTETAAEIEGFCDIEFTDADLEVAADMDEFGARIENNNQDDDTTARESSYAAPEAELSRSGHRFSNEKTKFSRLMNSECAMGESRLACDPTRHI